MTVEMVLVVAVALILILVVALIGLVIRKRGEDSRPHLDQTWADMRAELAGRDGGLQAKVAELDNKLGSLQQAVANREASLDEQVRAMGDRVQGISGLFSNDRARGGWGEISMLRIFELGGLVEGKDFISQYHSPHGTPDAVLHLPGERKIVVDCKFPIARYNEALAANDADQRRQLLLAQGKELEAAGKALVDRGYHELACGGYVVMYVASQAVYEATAEVSHDVLERLMEQRVVVTGPSALFALLMTVSALLTQHRSLQQADEILDQVKELHRRLASFVSHLAAIGSSLGKTVSVFNQAVGSWTVRVGPQLTRLNDLSGGRTAADLEPVDQVLRGMETGSYALPLETRQN